MIMNRSSEGRLLRAKGGRTEKLPQGASSSLLARGNKQSPVHVKKMKMTDMVKKDSGSMTHKDLTTEPSLRALGAPKKNIRAGLPKDGTGFGLTKHPTGTRRTGIKRRAAGGTMNDGVAQESYVNHGARSDGKVESCNPIQSAKTGKWIQDAINPAYKGALRKSLGVPVGQKIPEKKLIKAEHSKNPTLKKRAVLAHTLSGLRRGR